MDDLWYACFTAVAVMMGLPALAVIAGALWRGVAEGGRVRRVRPRESPLRLRMPLRENPARALVRLRESLGLHG